MDNYRVICTKCGRTLDPYALRCPQDDALPRTVYSTTRLSVRPLPGMWRFLDWLPVNDVLPCVPSGPITYRSTGLARELGMKNLLVSFNGYWPEKGADMLTCSFKELEALPTMQRLREQGKGRTMVVASAGNTARAFSYVASQTGQPLVVLVPAASKDRMWLPDAEKGNTFLVAVEGDYYDAIALGERLTSLSPYISEGGARNVARRDGMGTVMLDATTFIGAMPKHYFQAVGSGTGGISAMEASMRLVGDGRFGSDPTVLHLAQSMPCAPLLHAWSGGSFPEDCPAGVYDDVLFNRRPPFGLPGGVKDALDRTGGEVVGITREEADHAKKLFEQTEGIDIFPAPAVAVAALVKAIGSGTLSAEETCLLNITGGGESRLNDDHQRSKVPVDRTVGRDHSVEELSQEIIEAIG